MRGEYLKGLRDVGIKVEKHHHEVAHCERHHKVFNDFKIIPENCFGCFKVQANPKNVIDLIKLYLIIY